MVPIKHVVCKDIQWETAIKLAWNNCTIVANHNHNNILMKLQ